jgi:hypothetical protein
VGYREILNSTRDTLPVVQYESVLLGKQASVKNFNKMRVLLRVEIYPLAPRPLCRKY